MINSLFKKIIDIKNNISMINKYLLIGYIGSVDKAFSMEIEEEINYNLTDNERKQIIEICKTPNYIYRYKSKDDRYLKIFNLGIITMKNFIKYGVKNYQNEFEEFYENSMCSIIELIKKKGKSYKKTLEDLIKRNKIFHYLVLDKLGEGGQGSVFKSRYIFDDEKQNCIKITDVDFTLKIISQSDSEKERNCMKAINENTTKIYFSDKIFYDKDYKAYGCAIKYFKYRDVGTFTYSFLKKNSFSYIVFMIGHVLEGLNKLHKCRILHLDIKPSNIVTDGLTFNIIDFSSSYDFSSLLDYSSSFDYSSIKSISILLSNGGTCMYMDPERFKLKNIYLKNIDKIDIWAIGVMMYTLFYNVYPFGVTDVSNSKQVYDKISSTELTFPDKPKAPPVYKDFILRCLDKDINKRISVSECFSHPLFKENGIFDQLCSKKEDINIPVVFLTDLIVDKEEKIFYEVDEDSLTEYKKISKK